MEKNRKKRPQNFPKKKKFQKQKFVHKNNLQKSNQMLLSQRNHPLFLFREKKNVSRNKGTNNNFKKKKEQQIPTRATARKKCVHKERPNRTQFAILLQKKRNLFAKRLTGAKSHWSLSYLDLSNIVNR